MMLASVPEGAAKARDMVPEGGGTDILPVGIPLHTQPAAPEGMPDGTEAKLAGSEESGAIAGEAVVGRIVRMVDSESEATGTAKAVIADINV